ncbi:MAG TPA: succinate dehydrogenase, cytochrome b556 subunit [Rudaea sp.]|jgi:succinate dehydrogenase / fumarate reductase cytochrome b subunit|nr:succinate dehydrogenase, cytochrome b556 subunit [Rudaea sp.]
MSPIARPISPHLEIYRWRVNMWQSVLHRLTGLFLCLGALLLAWGLIAVVTGADAWGIFSAFCASGLGFVLQIGWSWALLFHLCNGIQHLFRDTGMGYDAAQRDHSHTPSYFATGWIVIAASLVLTALVWITLFARASGGAA